MSTIHYSWLAFLFLLSTTATMAQEATPQPAIAIAGADVFEAKEFKDADGKVLRYRLLKPINLDAADADPKATYPLVIFLHGAGERGDDNVRQLIHGGGNLADEALRRRYPAFVIAPQCPNDKKWVEVPWDGKEHKMPEQPSESLQLVFDLVDSLEKELPIDKNRIYGVGLSMGGFGTWDILQRKPELLAAAVPVCGGGDPAYAERFKATPVWAFHGNADVVVFPSRSRDMVASLKAAGARPIYTEYEGVGHDSWTPTFDNRQTWDWLFAQRKSSN